MPLNKNKGIAANYKELMGKVKSPARKKAISTIAHKNNLSYSQAKQKQAIAIAKSVSRKG